MFGKFSDDTRPKIASPFEEIYMLIGRTQEHYYRYLSKAIMNGCSTYEELVCGLQILLKYEQTTINIYEEYNPTMVKDLVSPLNGILEQVHALLALYPTDNIKYLATLCSKIQERSLY